MSDQPAQPIQLPSISQCRGAMPSSDLTGGGVEPTITVQLNTLGGQIYLVPLSVLAARGLLAALATQGSPRSLQRRNSGAEQRGRSARS